MTIEEIVAYATQNVVNGAVLKGMLEALVAEEEEEEEEEEEPKEPEEPTIAT